MAAGNHAKATNVPQPPAARSLDELRSQMAAFVDAIRASAGDLDDSEGSLAVADIAQRELAKERPDKQSFLGLLQSLATDVASVGTLASALTVIQQAAAAIF
jgi:hypothetical protein